ncbi:MAG: hypothetical protein ACLUKE_06980 [Blautia wexlerae]
MRWKKIWNRFYMPMLMGTIKNVYTIMVISWVYLKIFDTVYILTPTGGTQ